MIRFAKELVESSTHCPRRQLRSFIMRLDVKEVSYPTRGTFTISRGSRTKVDVVMVEIDDGEHRGRGECTPYARYGESIESVTQQITSCRDALADGMTRAELQAALPSGAARNALDCAFWDIEAKRAGQPAWKLAGLAPPNAEITAYTLSLDTPDAMRAAAAESADPRAGRLDPAIDTRLSTAAGRGR